MSRKRCFLFLQGVCSPFFSCLADRLKVEKHQVFKINFNVGDWAYWGRRSAWNYRGSVAELEDFLDDRYQKFAITDQILFGDCRPVHRPAVRQGKVRGIRTHVVEEGYFRPYWLTLEREGVNGYSLLPRDPDWFREVGACLPVYGDGQSFQSSFKIRAAHDVAFHMASFWNPLFFPRYRTHAPVNAAVEYLGYAKRLPLMRFHKSRDNAVVDNLVRTSASMPFFVLPLQLGGDAQIRDHSRFEDMIDVIEFVMESFARCAPIEAKLVIKNHPLDIGLIHYKKVIHSLSDRFDVTSRVEYMETGDLDVMLCSARGTVTVNSTVGALSVGLNCPTITLSDPIYNLPGLTYQGGLDEFWQNGMRPDEELFNHFLRYRDELVAWLHEICMQEKVDLVIVNAGVNTNIGPNGAGELWENVQELIEVNVLAAMATVNAALPSLRARGAGQIVLMSSLAAYFGLPVTPSYSASKAAMKAYGEALRGWLAPEGIRVNVVMPGYVESKMCRDMPGPKPFLWSAEKAAHFIKRRLARNQSRISFPFLLSSGSWWLSVLHPAISERILRLLDYGG